MSPSWVAAILVVLLAFPGSHFLLLLFAMFPSPLFHLPFRLCSLSPLSHVSRSPWCVLLVVPSPIRCVCFRRSQCFCRVLFAAFFLFCTFFLRILHPLLVSPFPFPGFPMASFLRFFFPFCSLHAFASPSARLPFFRLHRSRPFVSSSVFFPVFLTFRVCAYFPLCLLPVSIISLLFAASSPLVLIAIFAPLAPWVFPLFFFLLFPAASAARLSSFLAGSLSLTSGVYRSFSPFLLPLAGFSGRFSFSRAVSFGLLSLAVPSLPRSPTLDSSGWPCLSLPGAGLLCVYLAFFFSFCPRLSSLRSPSFPQCFFLLLLVVAFLHSFVRSSALPWCPFRVPGASLPAPAPFCFSGLPFRCSLVCSPFPFSFGRVFRWGHLLFFSWLVLALAS